MSVHQLVKKIIITGQIKLLTGLHIGGTNNSLTIGGIDKTVIRDPLSKKPIIPGTSLKGKMRSLIEQRDNSYNPEARMGAVINGPAGEQQQKDGKPVISARLFGMAAKDNSKNIPSRLIVRDAHLLTDDAFFKDTSMLYTEAKTEVVIDRITSAAMPRQMERVPAGAEFSLNLVLTIYRNDSEEELVRCVAEALKLVEDDYLGGSGSRGYGQVQFQIQSIKERGLGYYRSEEDEKDYQLGRYFERFTPKAAAHAAR
jgi:CRISPR-associated protein Csm3